MTDKFSGREKREFLRYNYNKPMTYKVINASKGKDFSSALMTAVSKNLSATGILFVTKVTKVPKIASIVVLDLDYRTASVCQEIENRASIRDNKLIGKVVRIEDNEDNTCGVGVAFVTKSDPTTKDIEKLIN